MNSKEATAATTAELDEDVILEIVVRLPLKCAIRCMVLNKSLCHLISQRKKALVSSACPDSEVSIFCTTNVKITPGCSKIPMTSNMWCRPENPIVMDSCNGVLLLKFKAQRRFCVFNPITSEIMLVSSLIEFQPCNYKASDYKGRVALAVDLDAHTIFQFKLVVAELFRYKEEDEDEEGTLWSFTVFVPSGGRTHWMKKSPVVFICGGYPCKCDRFVYVHGCMYYADEYNQRITVFDVEKENAKNIDWPQADTYDAVLSRSLDGLLQCAYVLDDEIKIHSYDQVKDVWELKHKITHTVSSPHVLFCDGQRLLIFDGPWRVRKFAKVFHMYDITSDKWEKIDAGNCRFEMYLPAAYFSFVPTLAKVSDKYLHNPEFEFAEVFLRGLQRLVMEETRDAEVVG